MTETKKEKNIVEKSFSWMPFWVAGFLFTLGIVGVDPLLSTYKWYDQVAIWVFSYLLWPLVLGLHFAQ